MKGLVHKAKNHKSKFDIYHGITIVGSVWGECFRKMTKLFYVVLLFELVLCCPCFAMFRDFFTPEEIEITARSHMAPNAHNFDQGLAGEIIRIQEELASPNPEVSHLTAELIIKAVMHDPVKEFRAFGQEDEKRIQGRMFEVATNRRVGFLSREDPQNQRTRRIFEMLNYYERHTPSPNLPLLRNSQVFLMASPIISDGYTLHNLYSSMKWYMKLRTTPIPDEEFLHVFHVGRALCFLDNLVDGDIEAEFFRDPYFPDLLYVSIDFLGKYAQDSFDPKVRDERNREGFLVNRIITNLMEPNVVRCCNGELKHALLIERLIPLFRRDNYIDYLLINHFRMIIARDKLERDAEEGLRYILDILNEQGISFPITSQGVTEDRPPIDPAFSVLAHRIYQRKYLAELRRLQRLNRTERDYRVLHQVENSMELYKMYEVQSIEEVSPMLMAFRREQENIRHNQLRRDMYKDALSTVRDRVKHGAPKREREGSRRNSDRPQAFPKSTVAGYNLAGEYRFLKTDRVPSGIGAASAAASSRVQTPEVKRSSSAAASTSRPASRETLPEPLILLGSNHYRIFEGIMNSEINVTRGEFENLLVSLQGSANSRSQGTGHTFYSVMPILDSPNVSRHFHETFGLPIDGNVNDAEINRILGELELESHRQGITLSIGEREVIPEYQLEQIREHLKNAGYTLETVGRSK